MFPLILGQSTLVQPSSTSFDDLLLHFDNSLADSGRYGHTVTAVGNAATSATQSKFGGYALHLDGTGDYCTIPDHPAWTLNGGSTSACTIDCWLYMTGAPAGDRAIVSQWQASGNNLSWLFGVTSGRVLIFYQSTNGSSGGFGATSGATTISLNAWHHLAMTQTYTPGSPSTDTLRLFIDGVVVYSTTADRYSSPLFASAAPLAIGSHDTYTGVMPDCYIDELRIRRGTAVWTGAFTPPTLAYS